MRRIVGVLLIGWWLPAPGMAQEPEAGIAAQPQVTAEAPPPAAPPPPPGVDAVAAGSFLGLSAQQSLASVMVITRDQINISGAQTLSDVLEIYVPGFQIAYSKWASGPIWGMRGIATQALGFVFLVNGVKQNMQSMGQPAVEGAMGLMQDIERVEVVRGAAGLAYGSEGLGGVVNVVTRTPQSDLGELRAAGGPRNVEAQIFSNTQLGPRNAFSLSAGFRRDLGAGLHAGRIYGQGSWPTTSGIYHGDGAPSEGSALASPDNIRVDADWRFEDLRIWTRWTRQATTNAGFFAQDPWPGVVGNPPANTPDGEIDGVAVKPTGPWAGVDSLGLGRQVVTVDNVTVGAHYDLHLDEDALRLDLAWIGLTSRTSQDMLAAFAVPTAVSNRPGGMLYMSFGEQRYVASAVYELKRVPGLHSASGAQFRLDNIGNDLQGNNFYNSIALHPVVLPVTYVDVALFTENIYWFADQIAVMAGVRGDFHTRAGLQWEPKVAVLYQPTPDHAIKLIAQSSSGSVNAFDYEYNYYRYTDAGLVYGSSSLLSPTGTTVVPPVTLDTLHQLQPERSVSLELTSTHRLFDCIDISPSISYNRIYNVYEFSQTLFRPVNTGQYDIFDIDFDARYQMPYLYVGVNYTYQRPLNASGGQTFQVPKTQVKQNTDGTYSVTQLTGTQNVSVDAVADGVTADGQNFLNLATHVTKLWATVTPFPWLAVHANLRLIWGLPGRHTLWAPDESHGENYLQTDTQAYAKLNVGVTAQLPWGFTASAFGYDLLGGARSRSAVRWQQRPTADYKEIYTADQPTFLVRLEKSI